MSTRALTSWFLLSLTAWFALACTSHRMPAPHAPFAPHGRGKAGQLEVGVARADITPPPGASLFGHGPGARVAVGMWTRLQCRAFYLSTQQAMDPGLAIVSCDLPMISTLLQRRTAVRIYPVLPSSNLVLVATHTHAGPGHFFDGENLSGATSSHFPGYDDAMVEFLAERIADAVMRARATRRPAQMRWVRRDVWELTRNRSLPAHRLNPRPYPPSSRAPRKLSASEKAVDPNLRLLEFRALDPVHDEPAGPIGSMAFFAMHPTVLPNTNRFYGADVFGVAARLVDNQLLQQWAAYSSDAAARCWRRELEGAACVGVRSNDPVHAVVNTNFGDITPQRTLGTTAEAIELGERLAQRIWEAHCAEGGCSEPSAQPVDAGRANPHIVTGPWQSRVHLNLRYVEVNLPNAPLSTVPEGVREPRLCKNAALGIQAIRGAADHPSIMEWLLPPAQETADYDAQGCQAPKATHCLLQGGFPEQLPLTLVRLGDTLVSFVPGELTIMAGEQINEQVRSVGPSLGLGPRADAVVSGIANGYIQYIATQQEYALQRYEGASTLYGPSTATYLAQVFHYMARHMAGQYVDDQLKRLMNSDGGRAVGEAEAFEYSPGPQRERLWRPSWDTPLDELRAQRLNPHNVRLCSIPGTKPAVLCMLWFDGGPGVVPLAEAPWIELVRAREPTEVVRVAPASLGEQSWIQWEIDAVDDTTYHFYTRALRADGDGYRWATVFRPNLRVFEGLPKEELRLRVRGGRGEAAVLSPPFKPGCPPPPCSPREIRGACAYP
ncbi:MAG: neutral/alkaline non-lysosomal ceramidase N-terminal domain-containing protein [Myxococcota bacterium]